MTEQHPLSGQWARCLACGYPNEAGENRCDKCGRRLGQSAAARNVLRAMPAASARRSRPGPAFPRALRQELSTRVQQFRSRQLHPTLPLQFFDTAETRDNVVRMEACVLEASPPIASATRPRPAKRPRSSSPSLPQPELNFPAAREEESFSLPAVAPVRLRMIGHAVDFALTVAALAVFCLSARIMLGPVSGGRFLLASAMVAYFWILLLYGVIFQWLAGATPAMKWLDLRLVDFDGRTPGRTQRLWRLLGVIVSAGSFLLGFLWAAVDEETLSWHDRISKTFLVKIAR